MQTSRSKHFRTFYLCLFFVVLYLPMLCVVLYSFNQSASTAQWSGFTFDWYQKLFNDSVIRESLFASLEVGILTSLLSAILGTITAIVAMYINERMQKALRGIMILPLLIPEVALGIALLILFSALKIPFGLFTLVLSHSLFCIPYVYIMVQLRLREIDKSIIESARDLGANTWQIIRTILLPLVTPAIITSSLLALAMSLDDVVMSVYMSGPTTTTLPVHIFAQMRTGVTPKINALCTLILFVTFFLVGLTQIGSIKKNKENYKYENNEKNY